MSAEVADVLDAAADYIEKHGLARGTAIGPNQERCAIAACNQGARVVFGRQWIADDLRAMESADTARTVLAECLGLPRHDLADWSDAAPVQEVLDAFRLAAKQQRMDGTP